MSENMAPQGRRRLVRPLLVLAGLLLAISVGMVLMVTAPSAPASNVTGLPPIPRPRPDARPLLAADLKPQLLVSRNFPDFESQQAVSTFDNARVLSSGDSFQMFSYAWHGLNVPKSSRQGVEALGYEFALGGGSTDVSTVVDSLRFDPLNAGRLCNAAVALFVLAAVNQFEGRSDYLGLWGRALTLLQATETSFEPNRAVELDLALFMTWLGAPEPLASNPEGPLRKWLAIQPADVAARVQLARIQAQKANGLDQARSTIQSLVLDEASIQTLDQTQSVAIGHAAIGDALMESWAQLRAASPFTARHNARLALDEYDLALKFNTDSGLFAGRASALDALGEPALAARSQRRAVQGTPNSLELRLSLTAYEREAGDLGEAHKDADDALTLAETFNPLLKGIRFVPIEGRTLGALGYSYGVDADHFPIFPEGQKGGGYIVEFDLIPNGRTTGLDIQRHFGMAPGVALDDALELDFVVDQPVEATREVKEMRQQLMNARGVSRFYLSVETDSAVAAVQLRAGVKPPKSVFRMVDFGEAAFLDAGRYRDAAAYCARAAKTSPDDRATAFSCQGRAAYWSGDYAQSYRAFSAALQATERDHRDTSLEMQTAFAAAKAGASADARRLYLGVANETIALEELGNLALDSGDTLGARGYYEKVHQAVTDFQAPAGIDPLTSGVMSFKSSIDQRALNNLGIARLESLQLSGDQPPDCRHHLHECQEAQSNFESAISLDAYNPLYLLNLAWVARLLGDIGLEVQTLNRAVAMDPSLYPALNDLGVYQAGIDERAAAQSTFEAAIAANPHYDLAAWNLGVLQMREGLAYALQGQAMLGRAIKLNPSLRNQPLEFRTDERIYRVAVPLRQTPARDLGHGLGLASGALGGLAVLSALGLGVSEALKHSAVDKTGSLASEHLERFVASLEGHVGGRFAHYIPWTAWLLTVPFLVMGIGFTTWNEAQQTLLPSLGLVLVAFIAAAVVHEIGHLAAASILKVDVKAGASMLGIAVSLAMLPFQAVGGPYVGHRIVGGTRLAIWWAAMAGPAANVLAAGLLYLISLQEPMPALRLAVLAQIVLASFSLLPFKPLDGAILMRSWPLVAGLLSAAIVATGILMTIGVI